MIIAIQPDDYTTSDSTGPDASSPIWSRLLEQAGHHVRTVDVFRADILDQLRGCDGFMWRHGHLPEHRQVARRLLPVIEREMGITTYPDQNTCWHYDDKISQFYLLTAARVPMPKTWIWFNYQQAMNWTETARYPLVIKLWSGTASRNVRMARNSKEAKEWVNLLFSDGLADMNEWSVPLLTAFYMRMRAAAAILLRGRVQRPWELHKNYFLAQEFVEGNDFDIRVVVIGSRAFAKRRFNRCRDFRASGNTSVDCDPGQIDLRAVHLAFQTAQRLNTQSLALDILRRRDEFLVTEISYTYPSYAQYICPGHWELNDDDLRWVDGHMLAEEAQIQDYLARLEQSRSGRLACV